MSEHINGMKCSMVCLLFVLTFFCFSCSEKEARKQIIIDLEKGVEDSIGYSLFVDSIEYINLDTTDECLIGTITDMVVTRDCICIFDERQQTIWIFGSDGRYRNKISGKGGGPEEYDYISRFEYDEREQHIIVLSPGRNSLLYYTPEGKYLKTVQLEMAPDDFKVCPQGGFILSNAGLDDSTAGIYFADGSGGGLECLVKRRDNHLVYTTSPWELCSYGDAICFMAPNFDNTLYHFRNLQLSVEYPFMVKPELKNDYKESVSLQHLEDYIRTTYLEGEKWIWVTYWSASRDLRVFVYSKETDKYWVGKDIVNDIDNSGIGQKTSATEGNRFVLWQENENPNGNPTIQILHLR